jgi:hypothetical protein
MNFTKLTSEVTGSNLARTLRPRRGVPIKLLKSRTPSSSRTCTTSYGTSRANAGQYAL